MEQIRRHKKIKRYPIIPILFGVIINLLLSRLVGHFGLPIYLDCVGTISVAALSGILPGIMTGFLCNVINFAFDGESIYYSIISVMIAVAAVYFITRTKKIKTLGGVVQFILATALIGGLGGGIITWILYGPSTDPLSLKIIGPLTQYLGMGELPANLVTSFCFDVIDKILTVVLVILILRLIPWRLRPRLRMSGWRQTPIIGEELKAVSHTEHTGISLSNKITLLLLVTTLAIAAGVTGVCVSLYSHSAQAQHTNVAMGTAQLAADIIDPEMVDRYIKEGEKAPGYKETEDLMYSIRERATDIQYIYVYQIREDGCHVVFDLDTDNVPGGEPGELVPFDPTFEPYVPDLLEGKEIPIIESDDSFGWLLTAYAPVYDKNGRCVCYAAADMSMDDIREYQKDFLERAILIFLGFFSLIYACGLYLARYHIVLPVNSMAERAGKFISYVDDMETLDEGLARIQALRINTGEEVENLYHSLARMCVDLSNRIVDIQTQARAIEEMQHGLILVMADMVERRDSDTGDHIQRTADYAGIIMKGLRRKGYYSDQLTDQFMHDVVRSAPLHDVGKISVSDTILNKPGKLTEEEYAIMKSHTTEGRKLLERAMSTVHGQSYLKEAVNLAGCHHERWDGKGYPEGLAGEEIPLSARIMAVADVFDALSARRVYKDPMPFEKVVSIISEESGKQFDPKCVEAFLDSLDEVRKVLDESYAVFEREHAPELEDSRERDSANRTGFADDPEHLREEPRDSEAADGESEDSGTEGGGPEDGEPEDREAEGSETEANGPEDRESGDREAEGSATADGESEGSETEANGPEDRESGSNESDKGKTQKE